MSKYNSHKPLRMPPYEYPRWRYGEGANISNCHYCICERCTGVKCRIKRRLDRCISCMQNNDKMPVIVCDDWSEKPTRMLKVERKYNRYQQLIDVLQDMNNRLKNIEEGNKSE